MEKQNKMRIGGLGKGLDAIWAENEPQSSGQQLLRIGEIEPNPNQPRREFDDEKLEELADSIRKHGLLQPITVRPVGKAGTYQIIAGERRWRASKLAGLTEVPVIVKEAEDGKVAELALVENIQRENLNPVEEAKAYKRLIDEFSMTQEKIAETISKKSRSAVTNAIRLLDLPEKTLEMVASGKISAGHGRALLGFADKSKIDGFADLIVKKGLTVRDVEKTVKKANKEAKTEKTEDSDAPIVDYTAELAVKMTKKLGNRVTITKKTNGGGKLEISFADNEELDELVKKLCGNNIFDD